MRFNVTTTAATALALLLAVSGCSMGASVTSPAAESPVRAAEPAPPASDSQALENSAETATSPGAYVDYYDGAIGETVGTKVLFFHAPWCPKCRALEKDITANTIPDGVTIFKVDFDNSGSLRQQYGVTLQTTIVYVDDDGGMLTKSVLSDDTSLDALLSAAP